MIKVLAVMDGTGTGGAETSMAAMAPLMAENGVHLEVAYFHDRSGAKEKFVAAGVPLHHVEYGRSRLLAVWRLRRLIKERRPDVVHTMVFEADIIGRTASFVSRVPVVSSIINEMYGPAQVAASGHPWKIRLSQLLDIATARCVVQFHAITNTVADVMGPRLRIERSTIEVIYRGRDQNLLGERTSSRRREVRRGLGLPDEIPLLLGVGRHENQKGLDRLLSAMPLILESEPTAVLLIAGRPGSATDTLERQVRVLGLEDSVRFLGHRHDVPDLLAASDAMVFPSQWEGLGGVVIEAIMLGCPVVCSDLPVLREVVGTAGASSLVRFVDCAIPASLKEGVTEALARVGPRGEELDFDLTPFLIETVAKRYAIWVSGIS